MTNPLKEKNSSSQWEVQSCSQGALVFSFKVLGLGLGVGGEIYFFKLYLVWRVDCLVSTRTLDIGLSMQVLLGKVG